MLDLSFNTKSNVSVFTMYLNANIFTFYVGLLHSHYNIHVKLNVLHNFTAVRIFFFFQQLTATRLQSSWKQLLLVMKIIRLVKGLLLFVYIHNKNKSFAFL